MQSITTYELNSNRQKKTIEIQILNKIRRVILSNDLVKIILPIDIYSKTEQKPVDKYENTNEFNVESRRQLATLPTAHIYS